METQHLLTRSSRRATLAAALLTLTLAGVLAPLAAPASAVRSAACSVCGRNLIKNPGAEAGKGQNAEHESGAVPGWTSTAGAFGAASYAYTGFWFSATSAGPKDRGKSYFFGGSINGAAYPASIGTQTIKLAASAAHHKATLGGWLGNYGSNTVQIRAQFDDASGKTLATLRIGPDTTIGGTNMEFRSRSVVIPAGTTAATVVITFTDHHNANQAGADDLSLVLT